MTLVQKGDRTTESTENTAVLKVLGSQTPGISLRPLCSLWRFQQPYCVSGSGLRLFPEEAGGDQATEGAEEGVCHHIQREEEKRRRN